MRNWFSVVLLTFALAVCAVSAVAAEKKNEPITLECVVKDNTGKAVPGAKIFCALRLNIIPSKRCMITDASGRLTLSATTDKKYGYIAVADGYSIARTGQQ